MRGARVNGTDGLAVASGVRLKVAALAALLAGCLALVFSSPAVALIHRGHEFTGSFGAGELSGPNDVAVNEATGEIYVLDAAHNRVVHYGPKHEFLQAWGAGVKTSGSKEYEVCNAPEACVAGTAGFAKYQFDAPVAIAVDNDTTTADPSKGDVYVIANGTGKKAVLDKFSASGQPLAKLLSSKEEREEFEDEPLVGVAVDPLSGEVWVDREAEEEEVIVQRLSNEEPNLAEGPPTELELPNVHGPARPGLAVDGKGDLYMTYEPGGQTLEERLEEEEEIKEDAKERKQKGEPPQTPQQECERHLCLAVRLATQTSGGSLTASVVTDPVDGQNTKGLALDTSDGDVYLNHVTSVSAIASSGALSQVFGSEQLGEPPSAGDGIAVDAATNEVLVVDAGKGLVDAYGPAKPAAPEINPTSPRATQVTSTTAVLVGGIDPRGSTAKYRFEYGTEPCSTATCTQGPATALPTGFGEIERTQAIAGLTPGTKYHTRLTVEYTFEEGGVVKTGAVVSQEHTFSTSPAIEGAQLPDDRVWEQVSPQQKNGANVDPAELPGGVIQASANGKALTFITSGPMCENEPAGNRGPEPSQMIATRGPGGWSCTNITTPNTEGIGPLPNETRTYQFFSSDLSEALVNPIDRIPLSSKTKEKSVYIRHDATCSQEPENCFEPLVNNENGGEFKGGKRALKLMGGTPDLKHVIIEAHLNKLQKEGPSDGLYEWTAGQLTLVSILPGGKFAEEEPFLGAGDEQEGAQYDHMTLTAISHDGNRVEWYEGNGGHHIGINDPHLYMRELEQQETLQVDELEHGMPEPKNKYLGALFQTANSSGSKVFFTDAARLTESSQAGENPREPDLYVFEPEKEPGERVTDLSRPLKAGEHAAVRGAVLGISEEGSTVYFVANGVLAPGAQPGGCGEPLGSCNLYVEHDGEEGWEEPQFIARLSNRDGPDWGLPEGNAIEDYRLEYKTSEVSPNGQYLAFMSEDSLTGYDNTDATGAARDEEVFLYNDQAEGSAKVTCVSCDPTGAPPTGLHDVLGGAAILVDLPEVWTSLYTETAEWLAGSLPGWTAFATLEANYQPRYLDNQGRLFFNSPDSLVPSAINKGVENVYEFEPVGDGTCASANTDNGCVALISNGKSERESVFLDASEEGKDVFFITGSSLVPQDTDTALDIYDARICEGTSGPEACPAPAPAAPTKCSGESCRPGLEAEPVYQSPGTSTLGPSGNVVQTQVLGTTESKKPATKLTTAQKLANALKACRKKYKGKKNKSKLQKCEKTARKHYPVKKASELRRVSK